MNKTHPAVAAIRHFRSSLTRRMMVTLACMSVTGLAACNDSVGRALAPSAAADEVADEAETIAGEPFALDAGTCPKGYTLTLVKKGLKVDANGNGWVCVNKDGTDTVDDEIETGAGSCPAGYDQFEWKPGAPPDDNGNGWICVGAKEKIDDIISADDGLKVNGHGNFFAGGKKGDQDISFSFHANPKGKNFAAKGQFEFHDQTNNLEVHGSVECLVTQGNKAFIAAIVTKSDDKGLPVGELVGWFAEDNGEPGGGADAVTRPSLLKTKGSPSCDAVKFPAMVVIESGNIQIH